MNSNILRDSKTSKIILAYTERGIEKKFKVALRFMDNKECYFAIPNDINFVAPKKKTKAQIIVYNDDGIYISNISILETNIYPNETHFQVSIPKKYDFIQCRASSRMLDELAVCVKYNDEFEINSTTYDISLGGVTFIYNGEMPAIYKRLTGVVTIQFPENKSVNFTENKLISECKYIRATKVEDYDATKKLLAFKFIGMKSFDKENLKRYLIGIK